MKKQRIIQFIWFIIILFLFILLFQYQIFTKKILEESKQFNFLRNSFSSSITFYVIGDWGMNTTYQKLVSFQMEVKIYFLSLKH